MSRVGKKLIEIPEDVEVKVEGNKVTIKGPKGELQKEVRPEVKVEIKEPASAKASAFGSTKSVSGQTKSAGKGKIFISPRKETKKTKAFWGLTRALLFNMVKGVTEGYEKKLQIEGVGYRATLEGEDLVLQVGFSHPVKIKKPEGVNFLMEKNIITVSGIDKELVGQIAAKIRKVRPPEPYKGKGIRYVGEEVRRKAGKKVVTAEDQ